MSFEQFQDELVKLQPILDKLVLLNNSVKDIIYSVTQQSPLNKRLYHYTSAQGLKGIIDSASIWATDSRFLNDSSEIQDGINALSKHLKKFKCLNLLSNHWEMVINQNQPHVISFCSEGDLLSQWRAYATEAEGYCIEFDTSDSNLASCREETVVIGDLVPVTYKENEKQKIISTIFATLTETLAEFDIDIFKIETLPEVQQGIITGLIFSAFTTPLASFKNSGFSEEKEWRVIINPNLPQLNTLQHFRTFNNAFIPYIEAIFLQGNEEKLFQRELLPIKTICLPPAAGKVSKLGLEMFLEANGFNTKTGKIEVINSSIPLRNKKAMHW